MAHIKVAGADSMKILDIKRTQSPQYNLKIKSPSPAIAASKAMLWIWLKLAKEGAMFAELARTLDLLAE